MKSGVLYQSNNRDLEKNIEVGKIRNKLKIINLWFLRFAKFSWVGALVLGVHFLGPVIKEEVKFIFLQTPTGRVVEQVKNSDLTPRIIEPETLKTDWIVPDANFSLYIPKIGAKSRIIPEVDPWDKSAYQEALKLGVAAAEGMGVPGEKGTTYLFAHSVGSAADFSRYNAIFYLLHRLETGDSIEMVFKNKLYKYQMTERHILSASDLRFFQPQNSEEKLVLQTCYPPGTSWKRLVIVARPTTN